MDSGHPTRDVRLLSGSAWLPSAKVGQVTLLDGPSAEVSAQVQVAPAGDVLDVVQEQSTAYAVDQTAGTVRRVDGATYDLSQPRSPIPDAHTGLTAVPGPGALYTVDTHRGVVAEADPRTLEPVGDPISLATQLSTTTGTVDADGQLWAVDTATGDLIRIAGGKRTVRQRAVQPGRSILALVNGSPVIVDTAGRKAVSIDRRSGMVSGNLALDVRPDDTLQVSGSPHAERLYVVAGRGALSICDLVAGDCDHTVALNAGSTLGAAVEAGSRLFVPDYTTGEVWVVDLTSARVIAKPRVLTPAGPFQLLTRDGLVFYNDPQSERAGVIRLDGTIAPIAKYDPQNPGKGVVVPPKPEQPAPNQPVPNPAGPNQPRPNEPAPPGPTSPPNRPDPGDTAARSLRIAMSHTTPAVGQSVTLQVVNQGGPAPTGAHWNFGDGEGDGVTVEHRWTQAKTYQVSAQATLPNGRTYPISVPVTVSAKPTIKLSVNVPAGGGTVSGGGITCPGQCTAEFDPGQKTRVRLVATPDADHTAGPWSGACTGSGTTCDVVLDADKTVGYEFTKVDPKITYTITKPVGGTIAVNNVTCPSVCEYQADKGQNVDLKALPDTDHDFVSWTSGCPNQTAASCTIHSDADLTIAATFKLKTVTLTVTLDPIPGGGSLGSVSAPGINGCRFRCMATFNLGDPVTLRANPDPPDPNDPNAPRIIFSWGGACSGDSLTCTLTMDTDKAVSAAFHL